MGSNSSEELDWVRRDVVGYGTSIQTPFGEKLMHYCDYTASGRALNCIETFMADEVRDSGSVGLHRSDVTDLVQFRTQPAHISEQLLTQDVRSTQ